MYVIVFSLIAFIFAYVGTKSEKIYYKILFVILALQMLSFAGSSVINTTINYGNMLYAVSIWTTILVFSLIIIEKIAYILRIPKEAAR